LSRFVATSERGQRMTDAEDLEPGASVEAWLSRLSSGGELATLLARSWDEQLARGYAHTLREIAQQPVTWLETAARVAAYFPLVESVLEEAGVRAGKGSIVLTGSGSSLYVGECLALPLQQALRVPVSAVAAGQILTHPDSSVPPVGPYAVVSLARSGNSPESGAALDLLLSDSRASHLILTCNGEGGLATRYSTRPRVRTLVLDEKTNDKSLVMTSSFTNMVLAGWALGPRMEAAGYASRAKTLARAAVSVLGRSADGLARVARRGFGSAVYLGSGCRFGGARESSLKMLEMSDGSVSTFAESYLGLRHGPMSAVRPDTTVVAFLSSNPVVRAYELDLLRELDRKRLGASRVIVGASVPPGIASRPEDLVVDVTAAGALSDSDIVLVDVVVGQILAFFRCLGAGLRPDSPSTGGVINRVVESFAIHARS
jgi:D-galactosamine 6-phosphate deaminase/isomerase